MPGTSIPALPQGPIAEVGKDGKIYVTRPWYIGFLRVWKNAIGTSDPPPQEPGGGTGVDPGNIEILSQGDIVYQTNPDTKQQEAVWPLVLRAPNNSDLASVTVWLARPASDVDVQVGDLSETTQDFPFEGGPHDEFTINVVVPCNDEAEKVRAFVTANSETFIGKLDRTTTPSTWNIISGRLLVPPITGFAVGVDVKTDAAAFDKMGRYYWVWNVPATPNFKEAWIQRRWTYPNWTAPAPPEYGGNWGTVAFDRTPASQIDYWPMVAEEWHEWRIIPVNWAGVPNYTDAQIVQVHVIPGQGIKVGNGITNNNGTLESTVQGGNLINNGGFEQGLADWTTSGGVVTTAAGTFQSGTKGLKLDHGCWVKQAFNIPVKPGDTFYAEVYAKSATTTLASVAFYYRFYDASGTLLSPSAEVYAAPATTWGTVQIPIATAPANTSQAQITVDNYGSAGACYIDSVLVLRAADAAKLYNVGSEFTVSGGKLVMANVDLNKSTNFNTDEFAKVGGKLETKAIRAEKIQGEVIQVGGAGTKVSRFKVFGAGSLASTLMGWIGDDTYDAVNNPLGSGYFGAWFKRILIGGDGPSTAKIAAGTDGSVTINGATFTLDKNGITTSVSNGFTHPISGFSALRSVNNGVGVHGETFQYDAGPTGTTIAVNSNPYASMYATWTAAEQNTTRLKLTRDDATEMELRPDSVYIGGQKVLGYRSGINPTTLADVITILKSHGLCS